MKKLVILTVLAFSIFCTSCSKDDSQTEKLEKGVSSIQKSIVNFDKFGISHNLAMDYVGNASKFDEMSKYEIYTYIQGYSDQDFSFNISDTNWVAHQENLSFGIDLANDPKNAATLLFNEGLISTAEFGLIDSLFTILEEAADYDLQTYLSINDFYEKVAILEEHIYNNYQVEYDEQQDEGNFAASMLAACSIMKYSYRYWREAATDSLHPWHKKRTTNILDPHGKLQRSLFGAIWQGIKVGAVDTGVFVYSIFTKKCTGGKKGAIIWRPGCSWQTAGEASSGV